MNQLELFNQELPRAEFGKVYRKNQGHRFMPLRYTGNYYGAWECWVEGNILNLGVKSFANWGFRPPCDKISDETLIMLANKGIGQDQYIADNPEIFGSLDNHKLIESIPPLELPY